MADTREEMARAIRVAPQPHHEGRWIIHSDAGTGGSLTAWSFPSEEAAQRELEQIKAALMPAIGARFTVDGVEVVVMPVEPTTAMRAAGRDMLRDLSVEQLCTSDAADTYRAMLRACADPA